MSRPRAGYIGFNRVPAVEAESAPGVWTLREAEAARRAGTWPNADKDPYFSNVSLLLHMDGTNGSTTFTDSSSNNLSYASSGVTTATSDKKFGSASAYSPNANSHVTYESSYGSGPLHFGNGDFTVEFWLKQDGLQVDPLAVIGSACNTYPYWVYLLGAWNVMYSTAGRLGFSRSNGNNSSVRLLEFDVPDNTWSHVAIVRSGTSLAAYVDGSLASSATISSSLTFTSDGRLGLFRHDNRSASGIGSAGYIDELRITKGVARYTGTFTPPSAPFPNAGTA